MEVQDLNEKDFDWVLTPSWYDGPTEYILSWKGSLYVAFWTDVTEPKNYNSLRVFSLFQHPDLSEILTIIVMGGGISHLDCYCTKSKDTEKSDLFFRELARQLSLEPKPLKDEELRSLSVLYERLISEMVESGQCVAKILEF